LLLGLKSCPCPGGLCNSWYKTGTGKITQNWSGHTRAYADAVADVKLEDYELV